MASLITVTKVVLLILSGAGFYATWYLLMNNGTVDLMSDIHDNGPRFLPGTNYPIKTFYTGITAVDKQLAVLVVLFWEMVDGSRPDASLFCYHFAGQVFAGWGLLMIESLRSGNKWKIVSFLSIWGLLAQNLAYAVIMPMFLIVHLSTSPTVTAERATLLVPEIFETASIPLSMAVGYILPTILMSLPAPSILGFEQKQLLVAFWQAFPLWVALSQQVLPSLIKILLRLRDKVSRFRGNSIARSTLALRILYIILLATAGANQVSTLTLVATSALFPGLFAAEYQTPFNPSDVFIPHAIVPTTKMDSIGSGVLLLLKYDELIGSFSMALWASTLYFHAQKRQQRTISIATLALLGIIAVATTGPLGYAIVCLWARDEIVLANEAEGGKKWN